MSRAEIAVIVGVLALGASGCARPSTAPSPSPTHAAEPGEPAILNIDGYSYRDADAAMEARLHAYMEMHPSAYEGGSAHDVLTDDGRTVGTLFLIDVRLDTSPPLQLPRPRPGGGWIWPPDPHLVLEVPRSTASEALAMLTHDLRGVRTYGEVSSLPGWAYRTTADSGDLDTVGYAWTQPWGDPGMFAVLLGSDADVEEAFLTETLRVVRT